MTLIKCNECGREISNKASSCPHCGNPGTRAIDVTDYSAIAKRVGNNDELGLKGNIFKTIRWFILANAAVIISLGIISGGALLGAAPFLLFIGSIFPLIGLLFSKPLAKKAHRMTIINENNVQSSMEESLHTLVANLSKRAGLNKVPEVAIYESPDMNAFATGMNRNNSLVAFSTGLIRNMDEKGVAAVAAHEIAHIANGDMITLSIVQGVVNAMVLLITIPLSVVKLTALFSEDVGIFAYWLISIAKMMITAIFLFLGNLVVKAFSRKREFAADRLATDLIDRGSMIHALEVLSRDTISLPKEQASYAAFKISTSGSFMDLFSTHPSLERRIEKLKDY